MLKQIMMWIALISGFLAFMLAQIFWHLSALSQGFGQRSLWLIGVGIILVGVGFILTPRGWSKKITTTLISITLAWFALNTLVYLKQDALLFSPRSFTEEKRTRIVSEYTLST